MNNDTPITTDIPEFEQAFAETPAVEDGSFEEALGLPFQEPQPEAPRVNNMPAPAPVPPVVDNTPGIEVPQGEAPNDDVRYQYWQSQAAQLQNQLSGVQDYMPMVDYLRNNPTAVNNIQNGAQEAPIPEDEGFPDAPARPAEPHGYTREEAITDPSSDSAKYLNDLEGWRDTMTQYNQLASQYQVAKMQEVYDSKISDLEKVNLQREGAIRDQQAMTDARGYVSQNYDLGDHLDGFIQEMSDDKSINMDDLVGYYKFKHGLTQGPQAVATNVAQPPAPSRAFKQVQRAQSVPTPMGVMSAQSNAPTPAGQGLMEALIGDDNSKNIL